MGSQINIKLIYYLLVILCISLSIGFLFYQEKILFFLYGYNQDLIETNSVKSFEAFSRILIGKKIFFVLSLLSSLGCVIMSYFIRKNQLDINCYLVSIVYNLGLIISIVLLFLFLLALVVPYRIV
jgi:hypothetical protein